MLTEEPPTSWKKVRSGFATWMWKGSDSLVPLGSPEQCDLILPLASSSTRVLQQRGGTGEALFFI